MNTKIIGGLIGIVIVIAAFALSRDGIVPSIIVVDQSLVEKQVLVDTVVAQKDSWLVVQTSTNNVPGPVIGYTKVRKGEQKNISVVIDQDKVTPVLYAMLHDDVGEINKLDFPGSDMPSMFKGEMIAKTFSIK